MLFKVFGGICSGWSISGAASIKFLNRIQIHQRTSSRFLKEDGAIPWVFVEEHVGLPLRKSQYCIALLPAVTGSHQLTMEFYIGGQMRGYIYNGPFFTHWTENLFEEGQRQSLH